MDITLQFDELLRQRQAPGTKTKHRVSLDVIEGFLREAYRIVRPFSRRSPPTHCETCEACEARLT